MRFDEWISSTRQLQVEAFGLDYDELWSDPEALASYMTYNHLAAVDELMEMVRETGWKPWSKTRGWVRKQRMTEEIVDLLHFVANIAAAAGIDGDEIAQEYARKQNENRRRMATGYEQRTME